MSGMRAAGAAALIGALLAGVGAWALIPEAASKDAEAAAAEKGVDSRWAFQPIEVTDPLVRGLAITTVLASRERAVLSGDREEFGRLTVPAITGKDGVRWKVLDALPLAQWTYRPTGQARLTMEDSVPVLLQQANIAWRLEGSRANPAMAPVQLSFQYRDGRWLLASESPIGGRMPMWEVAGDARWASTPEAMVITLAGRGDQPRSAADPRLWLADVSAAVSDLRQDLPDRLAADGPAVLVVPADEDQLAAILGRERSTLEGLGAITMDESSGFWELPVSTSPSSPSPSSEQSPGISASGPIPGKPGTQIIWASRQPWLGLTPAGRRILARHEVFHLLVRAPSSNAVPLWFEEAAAEWLGYDGSGVPREIITRDLGEGAGGSPKDFPADADFTGVAMSRAYQGSWVAADLIASRIGRAGLLRVYDRAAAGSAEAAENLDAALKAEMGMGLDDFRALWRDAIR